MFENRTVLRVLPVYIISSREEEQETLHIADEFDSLINTLGGQIVGRSFQKLDRPHMASYIGRGKIDEISKIAYEKKVDVVILDAMVKPGQLHFIKSILELTNPGIEVWDRVALVLHIFDKHASSQEAKLQIDLARMNYMGPRIYGMGFVLSRQGGGIGTSGIGETNTELMKRHWRQEKKKITDELEKVSKNREKQLERRKRHGFKTVSIVGYTNVGKSTLFNKLSKKQNLEKNALFATLDSAVGKMYVPELHEEVLISDTIGFIRSLPPLLVSAFKSTLMESIHADLVLHVIDVSDPEMKDKIQVVSDILRELGITKNILYVFNKIDKVENLDKEALYEYYKEFSPIFISVKKDEGLSQIPEVIARHLSSS